MQNVFRKQNWVFTVRIKAIYVCAYYFLMVFLIFIIICNESFLAVEISSVVLATVFIIFIYWCIKVIENCLSLNLSVALFIYFFFMHFICFLSFIFPCLSNALISSGNICKKNFIVCALDRGLTLFDLISRCQMSKSQRPKMPSCTYGKLSSITLSIQGSFSLCSVFHD